MGRITYNYKEGDTVGIVTFVRHTEKPRAVLRCFCGCEYEANIQTVRNEKTGCGCRKYGKGSVLFKHGYSGKSAEGGAALAYSSWKCAKARCFIKTNKKYHLYGGRGITMIEGWANSFEDFYKYMGDRPSKRHSLDRYPNKDGHYEPGNCRWATAKDQADNMRSNVHITHGGRKMNMKDWADETGIHKNTIRERVLRGLNPDRILHQPDNRVDNKICFNYKTGLRVVNFKKQYE